MAFYDVCVASSLIVHNDKNKLTLHVRSMNFCTIILQDHIRDLHAKAIMNEVVIITKLAFSKQVIAHYEIYRGIFFSIC